MMIDFYILEHYEPVTNKLSRFSVPADRIATVIIRPRLDHNLPDSCGVLIKGVDDALNFDPQAGDGEQLLKDYGLLPDGERLVAIESRKEARKRRPNPLARQGSPDECRQTGDDKNSYLNELSLQDKRLSDYMRGLGFDDAESS